MTRHCAISVDVTGVEPALGPLNGHILVGGRTPFAERVVRRVSGSHKPRPSRKRLPVELPGAVAPTGGCVLRSLLIQNVCVQAVQGRLFGAASGSRLIALLRLTACVGLVSSHESFSPPPRRGCGDRKELTPLSNYAFVRSIVGVQCHSRHLAGS